MSTFSVVSASDLFSLSRVTGGGIKGEFATLDCNNITGKITREKRSAPLCFFAHRHDNTIGPDIPSYNFPSTAGNYRLHVFGHLWYAEEGEFLTFSHTVQTCPHVFQTPSAVFAVVYVYSYSFSHLMFNLVHQVYFTGYVLP